MPPATSRTIIAEVRRRPELWNRQHPQHNDKSVLNSRWARVAAALGVTGNVARRKWKNLKDHFRKEYKRCMTTNSDQEVSRWPYFQSMMFIKEQITHTATSSTYSSDFQYPNMYLEVKIEEGLEENNSLNCLNVVHENSVEIKSEYLDQDENISDDKHFLLSFLPLFSSLPLDKKLKARIAIETSLLSIACPDLDTNDDCCQVKQNLLLRLKKKTEV